MQTDNTTTDVDANDRINLRGVDPDLWLEVRMEALRQRLPRVGLLVERYLTEGLARDRHGQGGGRNGSPPDPSSMPHS